MYQQIITERSIPVVTPEMVASFGRFNVPSSDTDDYNLLLTMIEAATDQVETMAATACLNEQVLETYDFFPGQADPRTEFGLTYQYMTIPFWWYGFPTKQSIELVRRPVIVPSGSPITNDLVVTYSAPDGTAQIFDSSNYTVFADKITLNVNCEWPQTDLTQDCVQITYWAGYSENDPTQVPARLVMAILYLSVHMYQVRQLVTVEPTTEVGFTLCKMLSSFRSLRIPR